MTITDTELKVLSLRAIFKVNTNRQLGICENLEILELLEALADKFGIDRNHGKLQGEKPVCREGSIG